MDALIHRFERFTFIVSKPKQRVSLAQRTPPHLAPDATPEQRRLRTLKEQALASALQQPQGLGLLFAGLRPKSQR